MKSLVFMLGVIFSATILVGCGGGSSSSSSSSSTATNTTVTPPPILSCKSGDKGSSSNQTQTARSYDLVIDNGRGTTNNQDTETPNG